MFEPRIYRKVMGAERFLSFEVSYFDTDLWIGINNAQDLPEIKAFAHQKITEYREILENYIKKNPSFKISFEPVIMEEDAPEMAKTMAEAARKTGVGPMAAVAGAFSEFVGNDIKKQFCIDEIIIENGGDIYLDIKDTIIIAIFAGKSALSEKIGLKIPPAYTPLGVCTSAGTVGHSVSLGKADALTVVCKNTLYADAYATRLANLIKTDNDIDTVLKMSEEFDEIISVVVIHGDKVGIKGELEIDILKN